MTTHLSNMKPMQNSLINVVISRSNLIDEISYFNHVTRGFLSSRGKKINIHVVYYLLVTYVRLMWLPNSHLVDTAVQMYNRKVHSYNIPRDSIKLLRTKCLAFGMDAMKYACNTYLQSSRTAGQWPMLVWPQWRVDMLYNKSETIIQVNEVRPNLETLTKKTRFVFYCQEYSRTRLHISWSK